MTPPESRGAVHAGGNRYSVIAHAEADGSASATCKQAPPISFDGSAGMPENLFGPAELLAASLAACLLKGLARVAVPMHISYHGASVEVTAVRVDDPPRISWLEYLLRIRTEEPPERVDRLAETILKHSTVYTTLTKACEVAGKVEAVRTPPSEPSPPREV